MSSEAIGPSRGLRTFFLGSALLGAAVLGALMSRTLSTSPGPSTARQVRPIVQITRQQPGLPDIADLIDRLCPSVAVVVPHDQEEPPASGSGASEPAAAISADGWLVTSASGLPPMPLDALFGDGRRVPYPKYAKIPSRVSRS